MDTSIFRSAEKGKFTEFSNAVKQELKTKLANNQQIKDHVSDFDKIQQMKSTFSKINNVDSEPNSEE